MIRIRELRNERQLSVRDMEVLTGISYMSINHYENEKRDPNTDIIKKLADFFQVTIDYLLMYNDYCVYASYNGVNYKLMDSIYHDYFDKGFIRFVDNKRVIDLDRIVGVNDIDLNYVFSEVYRIKKIDFLFEKKNLSVSNLKNVNNEIEVEITYDLIKLVYEALK